MVDPRDDDAALDLAARSLDEQRKQLVAGDELQLTPLDDARQVEWRPTGRCHAAEREVLTQQFPIV